MITSIDCNNPVTPTTFTFGESGFNCLLKRIGSTDDEIGYEICQAGIDDYIIVGSSGDDIIVVRVDQNGNVIWQNTYGSTGTDIGFSIQQTSDGGFVVCGVKNINQPDEGIVWVFKIDDSGSILWDREYDVVNGTEIGRSIFLTNDQGFVITGYAWAEDPWWVNWQVFVLKINSEGDEIWCEFYPDLVYQSDGIHGEDVMQTSDGGYIITGRKILWPGFCTFLMKTDENGLLEWDLQLGYGGTGVETIELHNKNIALCGYRYDQGIDMAIFFGETDQDGNLLYEKFYLETLRDFVRCGSMTQTSRGDIVLTGGMLHEQIYKTFILKIDDARNVLSTSFYSFETNYLEGMSIINSMNDDLIVSGIWRDSFDPNLSNDILFLRVPYQAKEDR